MEPGSSFIKVHMGGHHSVFCDGRYHIRLSQGPHCKVRYDGPPLFEHRGEGPVSELGPCDCKDYE